jgi:hypothetical protein
MAIEVIAAVYGTTNKGKNVTQLMKTRIEKKNHDDVKVTNDEMGGDPDFGGFKRFGILYRVNDGPKQARAGVEGDTIELVP